jgi:tripartite-type tricarboxylate transporter receptor subunit TctC
MAKILFGALAALVMLAGPLYAQPYPTKTTIRIIAPVPPGGNVDLTARAIAPGMQRSLGQTVIVENKTGAAGNVGAEYVARSAPDGYTLLLTGTFITISTTLYEKLGYDGRKDFTAIARLVSAPNLLVVAPNSPYKTVADLVAYAKANPGSSTSPPTGWERRSIFQARCSRDGRASISCTCRSSPIPTRSAA